jgi:hypothetical protein
MVSAVNKLVHKIGKAAFLAPEMEISPSKGRLLPTIFS